MRYWFLVFSNPVAGREAAYNHWYDNRHLQDLLRVPGIVSARRFKVSDVQLNPGDEPPGSYLALYEIEADSPEKAFAEIRARTGTEAMPLSDAIDLQSVTTMTFSAHTPISRG